MEQRNKTALVLGGGGARGAYEIGVWQALRETGEAIDMVAGSSVGAINGAMVAQGAFDLAVTLWEQIRPEMVIDASVIKKKKSPLRELLETYVDEAALRRGTMEYGLVTMELPSMEPRHLFLPDIPEGQLLDFIQASSALLPAFFPKDIDAVKYVDGGYVDNLPVEMVEKRGAGRILAVDLDTGIKRKDAIRKAENLTLIHCRWDLGNVLVFDGKTAARNIRLGYLDGMKALSVFEGGWYAFSKGEIGKRPMEAAETAARIYQLDPLPIYTRASFLRALSDAVDSYRADTEKELAASLERIRAGRPEIEHLPKLLGKINNRSVTLLLAELAKEHGDLRNILLAKPLLALFRDEAKAAAYLLKEGLL